MAVAPASPETLKTSSDGQVSVTGRRQTTGILRRSAVTPREEQFVFETLTWLTERIGVSRARFTRQLPNGMWVIQSVIQGTAVAQAADRAEIAMAWHVALHGCPYRTTRPRVTSLASGSIRPIAVAGYLGIPVFVGRQIAGVVELGGDVSGISNSDVVTITERLNDAGCRLLYDPGFKQVYPLSGDTQISPGGGVPYLETYRFSQPEWELVSAVQDRTTLEQLASTINKPVGEIIDLVRPLVDRAILIPEPVTQSLTETD